MPSRHLYISEIADAIRDRLDQIGCFASIERRQTTGTKALIDLIDEVVDNLPLPAAVVILGPVNYDDDLEQTPQRPRTLNPGILVVAEYSAQFDKSAADLWSIIDQLDAWWIPSLDRGEDLRAPITIDGAYYVPAGWNPLAAPDRCAGVFNLLVTDPYKANRT